MKVNIIVVILTLSLLVSCATQNILSHDSGPYISPDAEFKIDLPTALQNVKSGAFGNQNFFAVNFTEVSNQSTKNDYSVEWVKRDKVITTENFYKYWENFLPIYLVKNFGKGQYSKISVTKGMFKKQYPSFEFIANGINNSGVAGSIFGTAVAFNDRLAVIYVIRNKQISDINLIDIRNEYSSYLKFLHSFECLRPCSQS